MKKYKNYEQNMRNRRNLKRQGYTNIKIRNGVVVAYGRKPIEIKEKK